MGLVRSGIVDYAFLYYRSLFSGLVAQGLAKLKFFRAFRGLNLNLTPLTVGHYIGCGFCRDYDAWYPNDTSNRQNGSMSSLAPALLLAVIPLSAQLTPNPEFRETGVIPAFHRRNPNIVHFQTFYRKDLDGRHTLLLVRGWRLWLL